MHPFKRPTVFFDLETTGVDPQTAKIIEISMIKAIPGQEDYVEYHRYINPDCHIPEEASEVNHITDEMVKDAPRFAEVAQEINDFIGNADLGGYNIKGYDLLCLSTHFSQVPMSWTHRGRKIYDGFIIFCSKEPRNLTSAYKKFCGKDLEDAHSASADTEASLEVFIEMQKHYNYSSPEEMSDEITSTMVDLGNVLAYNDKQQVIFRVGKYKNYTFEQVKAIDPGYLEWIVYKSSMSLDTKICVKTLYEKGTLK